jgi:RNA polymerase sigma-70 factor, ECF subfamily
LGDAALVRLCREGDPAAFGVLYRRHHAAVRAVCRARVPDADTVDDLVQETFARLWAAMPSFTGGQVVHWLRRTAKNLCIDHHRRHRNAEVPLMDGMADRVSATPDSAGGVVNRQAIGAVLAKLRAVDAALLQEDHLADRPLREMAVRWGSTEKSLSVRLTRARRAFAAAGSDLRGLVPLPLWLRLRWTSRAESTGTLGTVTAMGVLHVALAAVLMLPPAAASPADYQADSATTPTSVVQDASAAPAQRKAPEGRKAVRESQRPKGSSAPDTGQANGTQSTKPPLVAVPGTGVWVDGEMPGRPDYRYTVDATRTPVEREIWVAGKQEARPAESDTAATVACEAVAGAPDDTVTCSTGEG